MRILGFKGVFWLSGTHPSGLCGGGTHLVTQRSGIKSLFGACFRVSLTWSRYVLT